MGPPQGKRAPKVGPGPGWACLRGKGLQGWARVLDGPALGLARLALEDEEGVALLLDRPRHLVFDLPRATRCESGPLTGAPHL